MSEKVDQLQKQIMQAARIEFLTVGFQEASLRRICQQAGVTTGALYKRFKNKDQLFLALVEPALAALERLGEDRKSRDYQLLEENHLSDMWQESQKAMEETMRLFYTYKEEVQLLLFKSYGSSVADFKASLPRYVTEETYQYLQDAYEQGRVSQIIDKDFLYSLMLSYYTALLEPLAQDWSLERALEFTKAVATLFDWSALLGF